MFEKECISNCLKHAIDTNENESSKSKYDLKIFVQRVYQLLCLLFYPIFIPLF